MTKSQAVKYYGSQAKLARALKIKQPSLAAWKRVPGLRQLQLEQLTGGKLQADPEFRV